MLFDVVLFLLLLLQGNEIGLGGGQFYFDVPNLKDIGGIAFKQVVVLQIDITKIFGEAVVFLQLLFIFLLVVSFLTALLLSHSLYLFVQFLYLMFQMILALIRVDDQLSPFLLLCST